MASEGAHRPAWGGLSLLEKAELVSHACVDLHTMQSTNWPGSPGIHWLNTHPTLLRGGLISRSPQPSPLSCHSGATSRIRATVLLKLFPSKDPAMLWAGELGEMLGSHGPCCLEFPRLPHSYPSQDQMRDSTLNPRSTHRLQEPRI